MGVRPSVKHIVGVKGLSEEEKEGFMNMYKEFYEEPIADSLLPVLGDDEYEKEFVATIVADQTVGDILQLSEYKSSEFIGLKPIYHLQEAALYDHQVIWSMVEAGILDMSTGLIQVPYEDLSAYLNTSHKENLATLGLQQAIALHRYEGEWGRKYKHSDLNTYDADLALAKAYLESILGFQLTKDQIQRYVLIEWG